jgi:ribosomal protein S27E
MDLPFCPACGSVRLAEEGGLLDGEVYRRLRCRDCRWAQPVVSQAAASPEEGATHDEDRPVVIRSRSA